MVTRKKILLDFQNADGEAQTESVWAIEREDGYEIDNIPFYASSIALGDIVEVAQELDGLLRFRSLKRPGGHSTIQLWFSAEKDVQAKRDQLRLMGCASELSNLSRLVSVDVPSKDLYDNIKPLLDADEAAGLLEYQESCLGF
jgi:Domain of unknown function (DUF4265)